MFGKELSDLSAYDTPYMLMDLDRAVSNLSRLTQLFPESDVFYAVKTNNNKELLTVLKEHNSKFDISSVQEMQLLLNLGVNPDSMLYTTPVRARKDIERAYDEGVRMFVIDSLSELRKFENLKDVRLLLRLLNTGHLSQCPMYYKFGMSKEDAMDVMRLAVEMGLAIEGFTFHAGSQCMAAEGWVNALRYALDVWKFSKDIGAPMSIVDIGGGFPSRYTEDIISIEEIAGRINEFIADTEFSSAESMFLEPGRFILDQAAVTITTITGVVERAGRKWVFIDVGAFNGLSEVLEDFRYEVRVANKKPDTNREMYSIAGPSCDGLDVVMRDVLLSEPKEGDLLIIYNTGAYSISKQEYNGLQYPQVYAV